MRKLSTKRKESDMPSTMGEDYMLPRFSMRHDDVPESKTHSVGKSHIMTIKATKVSQDEHGSSYKITHVSAKRSKKPKPYKLQ